MDRRVRSTKKDTKGNIVAICNPGQKWSPRSVKAVVADIQAGRKSYYVQEASRRAYLRAVSGKLKTTESADTANKLTRLPVS